ncbi:MAG: 50S ribosomal protein L4 [Chloroflexota bacterium]|nr:MAG: 50S ribosomal protein L4 [Chloroflexota bacterium]
MEIPVYDMSGEIAQRVEIQDDVFGVSPNEALLHQVVVAQQANARVGTAATRTRGMVAGGGKKPWRQKGTGRARQGTIRAPHWRGGGIVFGPHPRSFRQDVPRKMRHAALRIVLSAKVAEDRLILLSDLSLEAPRTREMVRVLSAVKASGSVLIALPDGSMNVVKSARNIPQVRSLPWRQLNVLDVLKHNYVIMPLDAVRGVERWLSRSAQNGSESIAAESPQATS